MPVLEWIGKSKVVNHHLDVPYHVLEKKYTFDAAGVHAEGGADDGNMIIHGDNLVALKSLLPQYEGRVDCIYIDPPYNTGNENWVYNDNVNDPRIRAWLGKVVGKEGEDLSRHDKWLCMMYPRLALLKRLLSPEGTIFVSIDDIEVTNLRLIMDEIFGTQKFVAQFIWKSRQNKDNRNVTNVSIDHEYILCYGTKLNGCARKTEQYQNPDNDPRGPWVSANMVGLATEEARPNLHYDLVDPATGINYGKPAKGWRYDRHTMARLIEEKRILWPPTPQGRPRKKQFLQDLKDSVTGYSSIVGEKFYTRDGNREQVDIFGKTIFDFPKNVGLIEELLAQATKKDSIVLDSFAGSGTTAHAVLDMNAKDGGHRRFLLIELGDYAESITAERVKRVICGYGEGKRAVAGTGGAFGFYELGPVLMEQGRINEGVDVEELRRFVFFTETRQVLPPATPEEPYLLGTHLEQAYYFYYEHEQTTWLNEAFLSTMKTRAERYVIYADGCSLSADELAARHITFKKIPRDIMRV